MIQDRVLKIMKGLNTFSQDDIIIMADVDENEADKILSELVKDEKIIPIDKNKFKYQPTQKCLTLKLVEKQKIQLVKDNNITFRQAAEYFLTNYAQENLTPSTFKSYKSIIYYHLLIFLKNKKLTEITCEDIQEFVRLKQSEKLSDKTIKNCLTLISKMFNYFKEQRFIQDNPYNGIINIRLQSQSNIRVLKNKEDRILIARAKLKYPELYPLIQIALSTGLKKAEILALKVHDIDFKNEKINIDKTIYEGKILKPKTKTIIRQVNLPDNLISLFKDMIKKKKNTDLIFTSKRLNLLTFDNRIREDFAALVKQLSLQRITFNELRHTYAYNALQKGMSIDSLHKQLGDYLLQATMDKYKDFILEY